METLTIWLKALHIVSMLIWCACLFYLPGLFAAHPRVKDRDELRRLRIATRFTYIAVASPAGMLAIVTGTALIYVTGRHGDWLVLKLTAVTLMVVFHVTCGWLLGKLYDRPAWLAPRTHLSLVAAPAILVPTVLWLVLGKPL